MSDNIRTTKRILSSVKGLSAHLQEGEQPLLNLPAIWDGGRTTDENQPPRSMPCDVILTNQRLFGYVYTTFPRERLFLDALSLAEINNVTLRQKSFEPVFRELLVSNGQRKVYIRAPRKKIEVLYAAVRAAIEDGATTPHTTFSNEQAEESAQAPQTPQEPQTFPIAQADPEPASRTPRTTPIYGRQEIRTPFESSSLAITLLFVGGIILEIGGVSIWSATGSTQTGLPLCVAGFVSVMTAIFTRMRRK